MTGEEQIICKYKFEDKEKFNGKPYCTCFNELCEDLSFACDNNCQIYEDFKQLARKAQECETLTSQLDFEVQKKECLEQECEELKEQLELNTANAVVIDMAQRLYKLKQTLTEIKEIAEPFCNACQEFEPEKKGSNCMYCNYGKILQKISECEELKAYAQRQENQREEYYKEYLKLSQECEALKSESFTMNSLIIEQEEEIEELKDKINKLRKNLVLEIETNDRYCKILKEIKEECEYAPMCDTEFSERVLDIINKVKGDN